MTLSRVSSLFNQQFGTFAATSSSQSSPLTSNSSEVFSHVIDDTDQTMTETLGFKREHLSAQERMHLHGDRGVNGMSSNLTSPTSCDYSSAERRYASRSSSADSRLSCTCCPYGQHIQSDQYVTSDGFYKIRPSVERTLSSNSSHHVSQTPERNGSNTYSTLSPSYHSVDRKQYRKEGKLQELSSPNSYSPHSSLENSDGYAAHSRNLFTKTTRTITSSNILPNTGENESLTISPEAIRQIKQHAEDSNKLIVDLQEQLKLIPQMQERIRRLKEDKKNLAYQLQNKSGVSSMRSIGVGDFDVDDNHVRVERIKQTVTQEVAKPPMRSVGVGVYDINTELFTQADVIHTVAEHVQRIREREIQSWIQEAEATHEARKASTRSFGVGDKNVWDEENRLIKERELKTLLIEQSKPSQRNVGMQVKPSMRDVCIEYSHQEPEPLTRSCGVNVDISDIMQEMASHNAENSGNLYQQQNSWTLQKHVIQRKFMDAMTTGRQEDLVNFITRLLKKSVRSVGVTAKPVTAEKGTSKLSSTCEKGVSNDSVDVVVKPFVQTRDAFTLSKPSTRTQPTWTDLILTCDAGTNTHKYQTDKSVNTSAPPQVLNEKTTTKSLQTYNTPLRDINRTITETTVTERRSTKTAPEVERKYHTHIDRMMTPPSRPVELDIALPKQLTSSERNQVSEQMLRESRQLEGQHRTEVHMLLPRSAEPLTPLTVKVLPGDNKIAGTTYTLLAQSNSLDQSHGSGSIRLSPVRAKSLTRECRRTARRLLESKRGGYIRSRSLSGDRHSASTGSTPALLSPSVSTTKTVVSEDTPHSTMKETTELTESGDTVKSERVIERTFSKSGGTSTTRSSAIGNSDYNSGSLADFDYFGKSYSGAQPKGHADRMERYMGSMRYTSTKPDVDEVRNITELHGNPLKSRYTIEEMSSGMESGPHSTIISESSSKPKSLLKDKDSPRNRKVSGVKFADEVLEQVNLSPEFHEACEVLQKFLAAGFVKETPQITAASQTVQSQWFSIGSVPSATAESVNGFLNHISMKFGRTVLAYIINMVDGNGNCVMHYSVSNCNFEVMKVILKTGLADADIRNKVGYTPTMLAALCDAPSAEDKKVLRLLLFHADVNVTATQAGQTALMLAVAHNKQEMMNLLLEANCAVNLQDFDGSTALMSAAEHNHVDIVKLLLDHPDIDVSLKDQDGSTALDIALEYGHEETAELLYAFEKSSPRQRYSSVQRSSNNRHIPPSARSRNSQRSSSYSSSRSSSFQRPI